MNNLISSKAFSSCSVLLLAAGFLFSANVTWAGKPNCELDPLHPKCGGDGGGGGSDDTTPPSLITDFYSYLPTSNNIRLGWTHSGDDGDEGYADHYVLLQAEQEFVSDCGGSGPYDFSNADQLDAPDPQAHGGGGGHELWADDLNSESCYAFSIEPFDEAGNHPGPSFTANVTQAAPTSAWHKEVLPAYAYRKILAFDPASMQPVVYGNDSSTVFFERSSNGSWTAQTVKENGSGGISLGYNPVALTFGGGLQSHRNVPSYAERQPDGSWDVTQITRENVRGNSLAFYDNGVATVAFRTTGDRILRLARYNGSSFDIETPLIPDNQGEGWGATLRIDPVSKQPTIVYLSEDRQDIRIALSDGGAWSVESIHLGLNFGSDIGIQGFEYDPNNKPVILFRQTLYEKYENFLRIIRKDSSGNWGPASAIPGVPDGMTVYPNGLTNQNGQLAIADDGTLFLAMSNTGNQIRVGRFCEEGRTPALLCETSAPTRDAGGANVWYWELVHESGDASLSIAIERTNDTIAIIAGEYYECDPQSASVICGNPL